MPLNNRTVKTFKIKKVELDEKENNGYILIL